MGWFTQLWQEARARAESERATTHESVVAGAPAPMGPWAGPLARIPRGRDEVLQVFGIPSKMGSGEVDPRWERASMSVARGLPGSWNRGAGRLYAHRLAEPYLRESLDRCRRAEVLAEIESLGCFNFRHQRHNPLLPLSYHSWGIALDLNSARNRATYFPSEGHGSSLVCWSAEWWTVWPRGLGPVIVECFESVGWTWGGRWRGRGADGRAFVDPMHFQLCG